MPMSGKFFSLEFCFAVCVFITETQTRSETMNEFSSLLNRTEMDDPRQAEALTQVLDREITVALEPTKKKIKALLKHLGGREIFSKFEDNTKFVHGLRDLLARLDLRVICPSCGEPAIITCAKGTRSKRGTLCFQHRTSGVQKMHSTVVVFPADLSLVERRLTKPRK